MTNTHKWATLLTALWLLLFSSAALASRQENRVFDNAGLFSNTEIQQMELNIAQFRQDTGMDFAVLTSDEPHANISTHTIGKEFYEKAGFAMDGVLYYIDMDERWHDLVTSGNMTDHMTEERINSAIEGSTRFLSSEAYVQAVSTMMNTLRKYIRAGIPEGQYRYDLITGQRLTARHKALTANELWISAAIAIVAGFIFTASVRSRYQLKGTTYKYILRDNSQMTLTDSDDQFLRTTTTRVRKPDPPSNSSGGGFGGGGRGSSVSSSSSGRSFGGGGGRF